MTTKVQENSDSQTGPNLVPPEFFKKVDVRPDRSGGTLAANLLQGFYKNRLLEDLEELELSFTYSEGLDSYQLIERSGHTYLSYRLPAFLRIAEPEDIKNFLRVLNRNLNGFALDAYQKLPLESFSSSSRAGSIEDKFYRSFFQGVFLRALISYRLGMKLPVPFLVDYLKDTRKIDLLFDSDSINSEKSEKAPACSPSPYLENGASPSSLRLFYETRKGIKIPFGKHLNLSPIEEKLRSSFSEDYSDNSKKLLAIEIRSLIEGKLGPILFMLDLISGFLKTSQEVTDAIEGKYSKLMEDDELAEARCFLEENKEKDLSGLKAFQELLERRREESLKLVTDALIELELNFREDTRQRAFTIAEEGVKSIRNDYKDFFLSEDECFLDL